MPRTVSRIKKRDGNIADFPPNCDLRQVITVNIGKGGGGIGESIAGGGGKRKAAHG